MNRSILNIVLVFLLILVGVNAAFTGSPLTSPSGDPGDTVTVGFTMTNTETYNITNVNFSASNLQGPSSYTISAPSLSDYTSIIANGSSANHSFTINIPSGTSSPLAGTYNGNLSLTGSDGISSAGSQFSYSITVNSVPGISVDTFTTGSPLILAAQEGQDDSKTFTVRNSGSANLNNIKITHNVDTGDDDSDNLTLEFTPQNFTLAPQGSQTVTVKATMDNDLDVDTYSGNVFVNDTVLGIGAIFTLDAQVTPEVCEEGIVGKLSLDIDEPDNGDNYEFGETIHINADVRNNHDKDLDVVVEAFLYNVNEDDELERVESDVQEIKDGDEENFDLDLEIPFDKNNEEDHKYILYIKAYEDGDENDHCDQEAIDLELERKKHDVDIDRLTVNPSSVSCGETISLTADIENVGSKDEDDVTVRVLESSLGLDKTSDKYDLEKFDDSDNDASVKFTHIIPTSISVGTYSIEAIVTFNDGKDTKSEFETLTVVSCQGETLETTSTSIASASKTLSADLNLVLASGGEISGREGSSSTFTVDGINIHTLTFEIIGSTSATITVESTPVSFTINVGDSKTLDLNNDGRDDVRIGLDKIVGSVATVKLDKLGGSSFLSTTLGNFVPVNFWTGLWTTLSKPSTIFWVIIDILLLVIAIFFIKVLFTSPRRK